MVEWQLGMIDIRPMQLADYDTVLALWASVEGVGLSAADERAAIARYLERNPGLSFVAHTAGEIVGAVLCGHDGRRGFIHHLAVAAEHRRRGIGRAMVQRCLAGLSGAGIDKCHLFVYAHNETAQAFWRDLAWTQRHELVIMSISLPGPT